MKKCKSCLASIRIGNIKVACALGYSKAHATSCPQPTTIQRFLEIRDAKKSLDKKK